MKVELEDIRFAIIERLSQYAREKRPQMYGDSNYP